MLENIDTYKENYLFYFDAENDLEVESQQSSLVSSQDDDVDLSQSYWMPLTKSQVSKLDPSNLQPEIKKLQLPQIS